MRQTPAHSTPCCSSAYARINQQCRRCIRLKYQASDGTCSLRMPLLNAGRFNTAQLAAELQQNVLSIHGDSAGHPVTMSVISVKRRMATRRSARVGRQAHQSAEEAVVEASVPVRLDHVGQALPVALPAHRHVRAQRLQRIRHDRCSSASRATCGVHAGPQRCIASHCGETLLTCSDTMLLRCEGRHDEKVLSDIPGSNFRGLWA